MAKTKKKKRDVNPHPGLDKKLFSKVKQEYHDIDYAHKLDNEAKAWMSQFMEEHLGANLDEERIKDKYNKEPLHKTKAHRKDCFDRNNARQRDIYGVNKATGTLDSFDKAIEYLDDLVENDTSFEDRFIDKLDKSK